jgi:hypothetical protein
VSKLLKLKKWLSIYDAAKQISATLKEPVEATDVLRLALDGHLVLSIQLVNGAYGRYCQKVAPEAVKWREVTLDEKRTFRLPVGGKVWQHEGQTYQVDEPVQTLSDGIWDLPLIGGERVDVEFKFQQLNFGPEPTAVSLDGVLIQNLVGHMFELQVPYEKSTDDSPGEKCSSTEKFHPAGALPEDSEFVVRTESLDNFLRSLSDNTSPQEKALLPRERETLLNIIAVMLELLQSPKPGRDTDAAVIKEMLENYGDKPGIKERTLQAKFPAAKRSLMGG